MISNEHGNFSIGNLNGEIIGQRKYANRESDSCILQCWSLARDDPEQL